MQSGPDTVPRRRRNPALLRTIAIVLLVHGLMPGSLRAGTGVHAAGPWLMAGDARIRHDIQWHADRGCLTAPVTTWPLSQADHRSCSSLATPADEPEPLRGGLRLGARSDPDIFRFYDARPRERAEGTAWIEYVHGDAATPAFAAHIEATAIDPFGDDTRDGRADGSWIAAFPGNWALGAGAVDRWWGPGWVSSLVMSGNARPVPGVWLSRQQARPFASPWLAWLGPWHLTLLAGQMESERAVPRAKLLGARFTFRPTARLEVGLTRVAQWGGEGRPESLSSLWNLMIGRDNGETSGLAVDEDPGNQRGGIDARYGIPLSDDVTLGVYGQMMGDDEAGMLPSKFSGLVGVDLGTRLGHGSQRWVLEATNTVAGGWFGDTRHLVTYEHGTYRSGYRYYGRTIASTFERDAQVVSIGAWHFGEKRHTFWVIYSVIDINRADTLRAFAPGMGTPVLAVPERHRGHVIDAGWRFPLPFGQATLTGQWFDTPLETVAGELPRTLWSASWDIPF